MSLYSESELDIKAKATVLSINRNIEYYNVVRDITATYKQFCETTEAKRRFGGARKLTEGVRSRILFELLCYSVFLTINRITSYVSTRRLLRKKIDYGLADYFNNQVAQHLFNLCAEQGITRFPEIVLLPSPLEKRIKFGDPLNPAKRLAEYTEYHTEERGTEVAQLGKYLSISFDPYNYPMFRGLWTKKTETLEKIAEQAMAEAFKPAVKLKR